MSAQPHAFSALGRALVQNGRLQQADANAIQEEARKTSVPFIQALVLSRKLSAKEVSQFAAETFGYPLLDLNAVDVDQLPLNLIDSKIVQNHRVVALGKRGNRVFVGMGYGDFKLLAAIGAWTGWQVLPFAIVVSAGVGAVIGGLVLWLSKRGADTRIPFGPYLALGGIASLLWGREAVILWIGHFPS